MPTGHLFRLRLELLRVSLSASEELGRGSGIERAEEPVTESLALESDRPTQLR